MTQKDQITDHEYDGIREYDNPTPGWWVAIFVLSVIFAAFYFLYYHSNVPDRSVYDGYDADAAADMKRRFAGMGELKFDEKALLSYMANREWMLAGKGVFKTNCVQCHGPEGAGLVGPNLTDEYYKNIQKLEDFPKVIRNGANNGAMPAWKTLHPNEVALVAAYVASLRGQNLPGPRVAGDHEIPAWPALPAAVTSVPATQEKK